MQEEVLENENIEEYTSLTIKAKKIVVDDFRNLCLKFNKSQGEILDILIAENKERTANITIDDREYTLFVKKGNSVDEIENVTLKGRRIFQVKFREQVTSLRSKELDAVGVTDEYHFSAEVYLTQKHNYILYIQWWSPLTNQYVSFYSRYKEINSNNMVNSIFSLLTTIERNNLYKLLGKNVVIDDF